jgi:flagellar hook-basal body complex protein FliE
MVSPISPIQPVRLPEVTQVQPAEPGAGGFQSVLDGLIGRVERTQDQAAKITESFLTGGNEELHSVALASQRASLEFELFLQVRNKVVQAYQEIMRMQV